MTSLAVFDMNETTLDFAPVRHTIDRLLGSNDGFTVWFQKVLQFAMTSISTGNYQHFGVLAPSALASVAASKNVALPDDAWTQVAEAMAGVEPFDDVVEGMTALRSAGWTTIALTNSAAPSINAQVDRAGLRDLFDHVISVDAVEVFKPSPIPYRHALTVAGVEPEEAWMIASHDWDLAGARAVGMSTAYISRPYMSYASAYPGPDLAVDNFVALARALAH